LSDSEILLLADEVLQSVIYPAVRKVREGYGVKSVDYSTSTSGLTYNTENEEFRIPTRAQGGSLYDVTFITSEGDEVSLDFIPLSDRGTFEDRGHPYTRTGKAYTIEGDKVILLQADGATAGTLRLRYILRPSTLVPVASCYSVTSISNTYRYNGSHGTLFTTSSLVDVVESRPGYDALLLDKTPTAVDAAYVTLADLADSLGIDQGVRTLAAPYMYVTPAGSSCVLQTPPECHAAFAALVAGQALLVLGFPEQGAQWTGIGQERLAAALSTMNPRTQSEPGKVVNWSSPLRRR
jgi:hypothetical protein